MELYHLTLLDIFKVTPPPKKRETTGPNPRLSYDSAPLAHLQQDSKQKAWQMKRTGKAAVHNMVVPENY